MDTKTLIQGTARIVQVTELARGDVYKRVHETYTGSNQRELRYGIVTDIMHNGTEAAIVAHEHVVKYSGAEVEQKLWRAGDDLPIFAATVDEITTHFEEVRKTLAERKETARKAHVEAGMKLAAFEDMIQRTHKGQLVLRDSVAQAIEAQP